MISIIFFIGISFITAYNIICSIFRGMGDAKSPMYFIAVACAANIVLDYLFICACSLGPIGAALGTTLAQTLSVIVSLIAIKVKKTGIHVSANALKPQREVMGEILKVGIPVAIQDGCIQAAFIIKTMIANHRGLDTSAAVGIVEKIISAIFIIPSSMLATVSALSAKNLGADKHDREALTLKYETFITCTNGIVDEIVMQFIAVGLIGLFTSDSKVVLLESPHI